MWFMTGPYDLKNDNSFQPTWMFRGDNYNCCGSFCPSKAFALVMTKFVLKDVFSFHADDGNVKWNVSRQYLWNILER